MPLTVAERSEFAGQGDRDGQAGIVTAPRTFLSAEWRWLAMLNYRVDPRLLAPLLPAGTELDAWKGTTFVSVVGFVFRRTRVLGVPFPFHRNFEELNLRFYVRRADVATGEVRRGVVFVKELVPRRAIATVARAVYNEPYRAVPMRHRADFDASTGDPRYVEYAWRLGGAWGRVSVVPHGASAPIADGSEEEFITEHYWGYTRQRDGGTVEYQVQHPRWRVWQVREATLDGDLEALYGLPFAAVLGTQPSSAFLADGSAVRVMRPRRLPSDASS
jgi:uncharacterized protein YqjF (DUF2071 family)